jgi:beta-ribofuranosylaminobenzene 5'-phosphate synthase
MAVASAAGRVEIFAPARLHLGFLDLNGNLGRRFGSLGLAVDGIGTRLVMTKAESARSRGPSAERALAYLAKAAAALDLPGQLSIAVKQAIPEHVGLGSGTQLGLAVAAGLARVNGMTLDAPALAATIERGARSGIGIGAFGQGGFIVDGGRGGEETPPLIARMAFPTAWRIVLIFDRAMTGIHGERERTAFQQLAPMDEAIAGRLCRLLVMRLLPGLAEEDFAGVAESLAEVQNRVGDHFAAAQGGRYASAKVAGILAWLRGQGITGVGQTSWGPTGFALVESAVKASDIETALRREFTDTSLDFLVVAARNTGAEIKAGPERRGAVRP